MFKERVKLYNIYLCMISYIKSFKNKKIIVNYYCFLSKYLSEIMKKEEKIKFQ